MHGYKFLLKGNSCLIKPFTLTKIVVDGNSVVQLNLKKKYCSLHYLEYFSFFSMLTKDAVEVENYGLEY